MSSTQTVVLPKGCRILMQGIQRKIEFQGKTGIMILWIMILLMMILLMVLRRSTVTNPRIPISIHHIHSWRLPRQRNPRFKKAKESGCQSANGLKKSFKCIYCEPTYEKLSNDVIISRVNRLEETGQNERHYP